MPFYPHRRVVHPSPRGGVQHGALLRGVDPVAAEHGRDAALEVARVGQIHQQRHGAVGDLNQIWGE